jgi:hypothetical protein
MRVALRALGEAPEVLAKASQRVALPPEVILGGGSYKNG